MGEISGCGNSRLLLLYNRKWHLPKRKTLPPPDVTCEYFPDYYSSSEGMSHLSISSCWHSPSLFWIIFPGYVSTFLKPSFWEVNFFFQEKHLLSSSAIWMPVSTYGFAYLLVSHAACSGCYKNLSCLKYILHSFL